MSRKTKVPVIQQDPENIIETPVLAQAIVDISKSVRKALSSGLTRKAIIVLIAHTSKMPMRDIDIVINNIEDLERTWLTKNK